MDDDIFALAICYKYAKIKRKKSQRKFWVHNIFRSRLKEGEFHTLFRRLQEDEAKFYKYYRMTPIKFNQLIEILEMPLTKQNTKFRQSIGPYERLTVFLR